MEPVSEVKCVVGLYFEAMMLVCYIDFPNIYFQPGLGIFPYQQPDLIDRLHFLKAFSYQSGPSTLPILGPRVILGWYEVRTYIIMFVWCFSF